MPAKPSDPTRPITAAIYVRVSTADQHNEMQLHELREYATRMRWQTTEYSDKTSGTKAKRPGLDALMLDARARKFDVVIVYKLDRFARSLQQLTANIQSLDSYGVRFVCPSQNIDTDKNNPASRLMLHILGAVAEFERGIIVERVNSGLAEHKRDFAAGRIGRDKHTNSGKDLPAGRPRKIFRRDEAVRLKKLGLSIRAIGAKLGVPFTTVADALRAVRKP